METIEVTLKLPADFARDAQAFDLLDPETLQALLQDELDRRMRDAYRQQESWEDFLNRTYGSLADDPLQRPDELPPDVSDLTLKNYASQK